MKKFMTGLVLALVLAGCADSNSAADPPSESLMVFGAASLHDAFEALGEEFSLRNPSVEVTFNFAGSQQLRTQIENGAPADVFASANQEHMNALLDSGLVTDATIFAHNEPVIVVSREGSAMVWALSDLPKAKRIVIGAPDVPIGRYTLMVLDRASESPLGEDFRSRVEANVVSEELNVRQVLAKVSLGEADAGVVYRTDGVAAGESVTIVSIPPELNVVAEYPIAVLAAAPHPELARAWVDFVRSPAGQRVLHDFGFSAPQC